MHYLFMNKNKELFEFNYNENSKSIDKIINVINKDYLPIKLNNYCNEDNLLDLFYDWLNNRYSKNSSWYKKVEWQYGSANINRDFTIKSYGLSLSDQYWIKPKFASECWENVNFFQNDFKYQPFIFNNLERNYNYQDVDVLYSPNITTGGELDKAWTIENEKRILYKSSNTFLGLEPINEYIATKICEIIDVPCINSEIKILSNLDKKIMVSSCETFINVNTELIHADELINPKLEPKEAFKDYINLLNKYGIKESKIKIQKMFLLDLIMANSDRHKRNFGVIRDVNTLKFLDVAPIYDTGRSMATDVPTLTQYEERFCLFNKRNAPREECLDLILGLTLTEEQIFKLKEIPKIYKDTVNKYFEYTNLRKELKEQDLEGLYEFILNNLNKVLKYVNVKKL